jgi:ferrochelatase
MKPSAKSAVLLLNFGGPRSLDEVEQFLFEILRDPNTVQLPVPGWVQDRLARAIARRRSVEVGRQYGEIGGRSPIVAATEQLAGALRQRLAADGNTMPVYAAHRYLPGDARQAARKIVADGVTELLALPLYPHFCFATSGSSFEQLREELERAGFSGACQAVRSYPDAEGYVNALAARLEECLKAASPPPGDTLILCSAHGLPAEYPRRGDPYPAELRRSLESLRRRFPDWRFALSYQSRVGPAEWLRPYTDEIIPTLAREGVKHLVFVPLSFVNDHIETLYEVGHTYFELARRNGLTPHRASAVEDHPDFVAELARQVSEWRAGRGAVPLAELLPPDQSFRRRGIWLWSLWLLALGLALGAALAG